MPTLHSPLSAHVAYAQLRIRGVGQRCTQTTKADKTDMLAGKYQLQYQFRLRIQPQLELQFQFQFLFRL